MPPNNKSNFNSAVYLVNESDNVTQCVGMLLKEVQHIGSGYNRTARPFPGSSAPTNAQYNTPINLYSADNIRETYGAQSEALQSGTQGSVVL